MATSDTVISYPVPAYANVPIRADYYKPKRFVIANITLGFTTLVETVLDMDYVIGQQVRLVIPIGYGCSQINNRTAYVISIPTTKTVVLDLDSSRNVDPYVAGSERDSPEILAIGDINTGPTNTEGNINNITYIPGSFINISPQ